MRDEQVGEPEIALQLLQQIHDLSAHADVERGYWLIANDELGPQRQGAGDPDALTLSAGEFVRVAAARGFVQADGAQEFGYLGRKVELRSTGQRWRLSSRVFVNQHGLGNYVFHPVARV